jgi:phosphatidylglycerol:prolipoprotein diacylglycerol transferase
MHPILFKIGAFSVYSYGFMVALAFLVGILVAIYFAKREGFGAELILDLALYVIIASLVGARLFYCIGQWSSFMTNPLDIIMVQKGGLVFLGGFLLDLLVIYWYARNRKINLPKLLDALAPGSALGIAIGRIGCFLNGCCFGKPTLLPWGIDFPPQALAYSYFPHACLHPTQLYETLGMTLVFVLMLIIYRYKRYDGQVSGWFFCFYALERFIVEFFRYSPFYWLRLTPSQWILIFIGFLSAYFLFSHRRKNTAC